MPTKKSLPCPRFEYHQNSKKEFNYRTIGKNGKSIGGEQHQGFKNYDGIKKNIAAHANMFGIELTWDADLDGIGYCITQGGIEIPLIEVKK